MNVSQIARESIPSNYFAPKAYLDSDPASGLLATSQGKRLLAIPEMLVNSIHATLLSEAGEAASMAFYTFGFSWGKSFYARVRKEIESYYKMSIEDINAAEFFATLQELWKVHGLGIITVDFSQAKEGILLATIKNSGILQVSSTAESKSFSIEAGLLGGWFSAFTNQDLTAFANEWQYSSQSIQYVIEVKKSH